MTPGSKSTCETCELPATVQNAMGIHCRPSAVIIKEAAGYPGQIRVSAGQRECDPRSVMHLMALGLPQGAEVTIRVTGPDAENFCRKMVGLFEKHFDFPPRAEGEPLPIPLDADAVPPAME
ncbi:MAG: HPr family phosphocarrier protein [Verrucomicrobiota bacterium]